jgi:transcriptional regulator with XRE-family HTH domain
VAFHYDAFFEAVDTERQKRGLYWKDVADQADLAQSTLIRLGKGRRPDVETVVKLLEWLNVSSTMFFSGPTDEPTMLRITSAIEADADMSDEAKLIMRTLLITIFDQLRNV